MNKISIQIQKRANKLGVSINSLCREAGVSRSWFENLKERVPKPVEAYLKIEKFLSDLENK